MKDTWLGEIRWNQDGLVPAIVQEVSSGQVLMCAWMNQQALSTTVDEGYAAFWSRSRQKLWRKGEESGHRQKVLDIRLDCDQDVILLQVQQIGGIACHTGRHHCFFRKLKNGEWQVVEKVLKDPDTIYGK